MTGTPKPSGQKGSKPSATEPPSDSATESKQQSPEGKKLPPVEVKADSSFKMPEDRCVRIYKTKRDHFASFTQFSMRDLIAYILRQEELPNATVEQIWWEDEDVCISVTSPTFAAVRLPKDGGESNEDLVPVVTFTIQAKTGMIQQ